MTETLLTTAFDILFRADASPLIGSGHLMRCLALANELQSQGARCAFLVREQSLGQLGDSVKAQGHELLLLPGGATNAAQQEEDASMCRSALAGLVPARWLVVDHYALDARWEKAMRPVANAVMAIDDLANREHDADLLLDQNLVPEMEQRYESKLRSGCRQLLGPRYALLRREFWHQVDALRGVGILQPRLLLMFGGADPQALTLRVLRILVAQGWLGEVDVVAGSLFLQLDELRSLLTQLPQARLHVASFDIANLMRRADLALGSPGVSSWERCCTGLPTIAISQADNQEEIGAALARVGAHLYLGRAEDLGDEDIRAALQVMCGTPWLRQAMAIASLRVCDGGGALRVANVLLRSAMQIRPAGITDATLLFTWRNDERTRRQSLNACELNYSAHVDWMTRTLANPDEILLLGLESGVPAACVRFSISGERARVSIYTDPARHGQGLGSAALKAASSWLRLVRPELRIIEADVLQDNIASITMFRVAGYIERWSRYEFPLEPARYSEPRSDENV